MSKKGLKLSSGLGIHSNSCMAFVGAGGKTSAILTIAKELKSRVFITTSTHFGLDQVKNADYHWIINTPKDLNVLINDLPEGIHAVTGPITQDNRVQGLSIRKMTILRTIAKGYHAPLLIEADGARQLAFKAPADHEPVIPKWVDSVVVCCGLSILGKPLSNKYVHRVDKVIKLIGKSENEIIRFDDVIGVLSNPKGGLKSIPKKAKKLLLLNQADVLEDLAGIKIKIPQLLETYSTVILCSLVNKKIESIFRRITGIILAAGKSERFGKNKLIEDWHGQPIIRHVAETLVSTKVHSIHVVVGFEPAKIKTALRGLNIDFISNHNWRTGQGSSVKAAIDKLDEDIGGSIILLGDQPQIKSSLIDSLISEHSDTLAQIIVPFYNKYTRESSPL